MTYQSLDEVRQAIDACSCALCKGRTKPVPGCGNPTADVMFIGEGPGFHEDKQGKPFVGAAGTFLNELLASVGLVREDVYITNMVHARPPGNRDPLPEELDASWPYLSAEIALVGPRLIVTLGRHSKARFLPDVGSISEVHGQAFIRSNPVTGAERQWYVALYHPAAGLHKQELKDTISKDFFTIKQVLDVIRAEGN